MSDSKPTNPKDSVGIAKVPISTVSATVMSEVGLAMAEGALKYGRHNYRTAGVKASVYVDAAWRHLFLKWWDMGQDIDAESGLSHVTKAIASLVVLRDSMIKGNWVDDRPPKQDEFYAIDLDKHMATLLAKYPDCKPAFTEKPL
jgi:hypothetical protein